MPDGAHEDADALALRELRRELDEIDEALLDLLARRAEALERVGALKARSGLKVFHREREDELLRAKRRLAERRGQDPDFIENVFRQIILQSHRQQTDALRRKRAPDPKTIAVVGGEGQMGSFLRRIFGEVGHATISADLDTALSPEQAAARADVVIISVPIDATVEVIRRVGPQMRQDALLMDVTSLKAEPVRAMLEHAPCEVVGAHPMFGPTVDSLHRQVVVLCPARGRRWAAWLREALESQAAEVLETTPERHDRLMAVIQVLRHFATMAFGRALADLGVDIQETLRFTSPIYRLELAMVGRHFAQSPELYAEIEMRNPQRAEVIEALRRSVDELGDIVRDADREAFVEEFRRIGAFFGDFRERALEESSYLIARMVERM